MKFKSIAKTVFLFALLTSAGFATGKNVNVEFDKGQNSARYSGVIKGYDYDTYNFRARKGQKVHVSISNEGADTYLFGRELAIPLTCPDIHLNWMAMASTRYRRPENTN